MKHYKKSKILGSALALMLLFSWGCGPDEVTPPPFPPPSNNTDDVGPGDEPDGWENNWNNPPDGGFPAGCEPNLELGVLTAPSNRTINQEIVSNPGQVTTCYEGQEESGHWLITFEVAERVIVDLFATSPIGAHPFYQVNAGECLTAEPRICSQEPGHRFIADPGQTYFVWVEKPVITNQLRFNAELSLEEYICWPGEISCGEGEVTICHQAKEWRRVGMCVEECMDAQSCEGDHCDDAITVDLVADAGPVTFTGDRHAFTGHWSAEGRPGCNLFKDELLDGEADVGARTPDGEIFFRVPGLQVGQILSVQAVNQSGNYGFFILEDCDAESCLDAGSFDQQVRRRLEWEVSASGDYTVIVEALGADNRNFTFEFELRN